MRGEDRQDAEKRRLAADIRAALGGGGPWEPGMSPGALAWAIYDASVLEQSWPGFGKAFARALSGHPTERRRVVRGLRMLADYLSLDAP